MIARAELIDLLFVIAPHALLLDIAGPAEAFRLANDHRVTRGLAPRFRLRFAGMLPSTETSVGLSLANLEPLPNHLEAPTWVVVAGRPTTQLQRVTPATRSIERWLRHTLREPLSQPEPRHRLVTICSGSLLAARAGLLRGRSCTTHHELLGMLQGLAPAADVLANRVFVVDGPVSTSAGIAAGIDLALHLIAGECGEALASAVAEDMVVYLRRTPRDTETSPYLVHRHHLHPAVHRVQDAIIGDPCRAWDMATLAEMAHATQRHLLRLFQDQAGVSPMQYLRLIRLERARQSIERGATVSRAAELAGFRSVLQLRRTWHRHWGGSPRDAIRAAMSR
jgi:transcriptional regulator GlxA family with amidase domain